jgi:L-fuconolactonase
LKIDTLALLTNRRISSEQLEGVIAVVSDNSEKKSAELLVYAASQPLVKGVIGYTNLLADNLPERLDQLKEIDLLVGFTHHFSDNITLSQLSSPQFIRGVKVLKVFSFPFDLMLDWSEISRATSFADNLPGVKIALSFEDYPGKKPLLDKNEWENELKELLFSPDLYFKIPGGIASLSKKSNRLPHSDYLVESLLNIIGPDRIMFGSNRSDKNEQLYSELSDSFEKSISQYGKEISEKILFRNSLEFYGIREF